MPPTPLRCRSPTTPPSSSAPWTSAPSRCAGARYHSTMARPLGWLEPDQGGWRWTVFSCCFSRSPSPFSTPTTASLSRQTTLHYLIYLPNKTLAGNCFFKKNVVSKPVCVEPCPRQPNSHYLLESRGNRSDLGCSPFPFMVFATLGCRNGIAPNNSNASQQCTI